MAAVEDLGPVTVQKRGLIRLGAAKSALGVDDGDTLHMWIEDGRIVLEPVDLVPRRERYLQSSEWRQALRDALDDLRARRVSSFGSIKDAIEALHQNDAD